MGKHANDTRSPLTVGLRHSRAPLQHYEKEWLRDVAAKTSHAIYTWPNGVVCRAFCCVDPLQSRITSVRVSDTLEATRLISYEHVSLISYNVKRAYLLAQTFPLTTPRPGVTQIEYTIKDERPVPNNEHQTSECVWIVTAAWNICIIGHIRRANSRTTSTATSTYCLVLLYYTAHIQSYTSIPFSSVGTHARARVRLCGV